MCSTASCSPAFSRATMESLASELMRSTIAAFTGDVPCRSRRSSASTSTQVVSAHSLTARPNFSLNVAQARSSEASLRRERTLIAMRVTMLMTGNDSIHPWNGMPTTKGRTMSATRGLKAMTPSNAAKTPERRDDAVAFPYSSLTFLSRLMYSRTETRRNCISICSAFVPSNCPQTTVSCLLGVASASAKTPRRWVPSLPLLFLNLRVSGGRTCSLTPLVHSPPLGTSHQENGNGSNGGNGCANPDPEEKGQSIKHHSHPPRPPKASRAKPSIASRCALSASSLSRRA